MKRSIGLKILTFSLLACVWAGAAILIRHEIVKSSYSVSQMRDELRKLKEDRLKLQTRVENLQSPARLEKLAKGKFDFGPPKKDQIIYVPDPASTQN